MKNIEQQEKLNQEYQDQEPQEISDQELLKEETQDKSRLFRLIEKSHKQALIAFKIEELLAGKRMIRVDEQKKLLEQLPEEIAKKFSLIIKEYSAQQQVSYQENWELIEMLEGYGDFEGQPITPFVMGKEIFNMRVGTSPLGNVYFSQEEGYFIMQCEDPIDYACALEGKTHGEISEKSLKSGGTFHGSMKLMFGNHNIETPVLLIKGPTKASTKSVIAHERQHFINHRLFGKFENTERSVSAEHFRDLKDEVLAYVRDGSSGELLKEALYGELYTHLFAKLPPEDRGMVSRIINDVASFLDSHYNFLSTNSEARAVLVYQLAGISFDKFSKWLKAYSEYYEERSKLSDVFYETRIDTDLLYDKFPWPKQTKTALEEIDALHVKITQIRKSANELIYNLSEDPDKLKKQIAQLNDEFKKLIKKVEKTSKKLMKDGVVMPHSSDTRICKYNKKEFEENETTKRIEEKVISEVRDFSQKEIDKIVSYFVNHEQTPPNSLSKLERAIKDIIKNENDGQSCYINFRRGGMYSDSFMASIEYKFSKSEQKNGIIGATFDLNFHGSKFKIVTKREDRKYDADIY